MSNTNWISVSVRLPELNQTVWLANNEKDFVMLGCRVWAEDGWLWAISNGTIYSENGKIVSECELDDEYDITHWHELPEMPKQEFGHQGTKVQINN